MTLHTPTETATHRAEDATTAYRSANRVAVAYLGICLPYILLSDRLVEILVAEPYRDDVHSLKGLVFVLVTAAVLHALTRRAVERTASAAARMEEAQRIARVGDWSLDLETDRLRWSREMLRIYGLDAFDGSFDTLLERVHPDDRELVSAARRDADVEEPFDVEHRIVTPDGEVRWVHARGRLEVDDGEPRRLVGTGQDITARRRAEERARRAVAQVHALAQHLTTLREAERQRLSRDVHDQLGQIIAALRVNVARLQRTELSEDAAVILEDTETIVEELSNETRRLARELRPPVVDRRGLVPALRELVEAVSARATTAIELVADDEAILASPDHATHLYRLCQEALTNVIRHADADRAWLRVMRDGDHLTLEIEDDGCGATQDDVGVAYGGGLGMTSMVERAEILGGSFGVVAGENGGTTIRVRVPLARLEAA